jgi:VanZ family protein
MSPQLLLWRAAATAWAAQIYWLSASPKLTSDNTRSFLAEFLERWTGWRGTPEEIRMLGLIVRKCAHFTLYAVLTFLVFQCLRGTSRTRRAIWSVALAAAYACSDELHQAFVPGRGASVVDWVIDVAGAMCVAYALAGRRGGQPAGMTAVACGDSALSRPPAPTEVAE